MVWALVLAAVAIVGALVIMRSKPADAPVAVPPADDDEPDTPPIVDAPKKDPRPKQLLTPGGSQPIAKVPEKHDEIPLPPPRAPSSIPLEPRGGERLDDPLDGMELGAPGGTARIEDSISKYQAPEITFDPSTPSIPLATEDVALATARTKSATIPPIARAKAPSVPPILERPTVPTIPPPIQQAAESGLSMRAKRPSSSPPLTEGGVVVRMRPPTNPPVAADAPRKGTPGQGVVIRAKPPTAPPLLEGPRRGTPGSGVAITRSKTPGALPQIDIPEEPPVVVPAALAGKLRYATLSATLTHVGIEARREDGFARTVMWPDVVGIVARRRPPEEPWEGAPLVDVVSTAGATLRIVPWTRLAGERLDGEGIERARAFVQLAAARCPSAKLDAATRTFLGSHGQAAQLPDEPTLAAHDRRLS